MDFRFHIATNGQTQRVHCECIRCSLHRRSEISEFSSNDLPDNFPRRHHSEPFVLDRGSLTNNYSRRYHHTEPPGLDRSGLTDNHIRQHSHNGIAGLDRNGPADNRFCLREGQSYTGRLQDAPMFGCGQGPWANAPPDPSKNHNKVVATISNGSHGNLQFPISRRILFDFLPRTRCSVRHGILDLDAFFHRNVMDDNPESILRQAICFIFGHLEEYSHNGRMDMFGLAERELEQSAHQRRCVANKWGALMHALCVVLDNDRGLGCSPSLLDRIMRFLGTLLPEVHGQLGQYQTEVLFLAFTGIFTSSRNGQAQLWRIWDRFDCEMQEKLFVQLRLTMQTDGFGGSAQGMFLALQRGGP